MRQHLFDYRRIFNAGNDFHSATTLMTGFDVDSGNTFQALHPVHSHVMFCYGLIRRSFRSGGLTALASFGGCDLTRCLLFGANTQWKRVRLTRGLGTSAASFAMKSSGSKKTCVAPSRYGVLSSYLTCLFSVSDKRFSDSAGRVICLMSAVRQSCDNASLAKKNSPSHELATQYEISAERIRQLENCRS